MVRGRLGRARGLRLAAATGGGLAGHAAGAISAQIRLLCAPAGVRVRDPHHGPARLVHFLAAIVANENCSPCHERNVAEMPRKSRRSARTTNTPRAKQGEERLLLGIETEFARADHAQMPWSEIRIVRPPRYCSTTAGETYEARQTAGVFPSCSATRRITRAYRPLHLGLRLGNPCRFARSASAIAAMSVPPHVRKSLAVNSSPMYALT